MVSKGEAEDNASDIGQGTIEVFSVNAGKLFIDGRDEGTIEAKETRRFQHQKAGKHRLEVKTPDSETKDVTLESGTVTDISFGQKSPLDPSHSTPAGTFEVESLHGLSGEVRIDGMSIGRLEKDQKLHLENITVGPHRMEIMDLAANQVEIRDFEIKRNQTTYVSVAPAPPTGLTATVQ